MRTKRTIHPLLNQPTKNKWVAGKTADRLLHAISHNCQRKILIICKIPLPDELKLRILYQNYSRKRIRRRK